MPKELGVYLLIFVRKKQNIPAILWFEVLRIFKGNNMKKILIVIFLIITGFSFYKLFSHYVAETIGVQHAKETSKYGK